MNVETLIFDMDGTILNEKKELDSVLRTISPALQEQGKQLLIATGRLAQMTYVYLNELGINDAPLVSCNGAVIGYRSEVDPIYAAKFPYATTMKLIDKAQSLDLLFHIFTLDGLIGTTNAGRLAYYSEANESKETEDQVPIFVGEKYLTPEYLSKTIKFLIVGAKNAALNEFWQYANELDLEVVSSGDNLTDVTLKGVTKGSSLQRLHDKGLINLATTMAFGDNDNDISMLDIVGYPVVMENASDEVKAHASAICGANEDNGVGRYLEQLFLTHK